MRLGARLNAPCEVVGLHTEPSFQVIVLRDGSEIPTRAIIVASGTRYRRLAVENLDRFEGAGVCFAAGDVRHGSMKRVAAAVGEGSSAVRSVHERLAAPTQS